MRCPAPCASHAGGLRCSTPAQARLSPEVVGTPARQSGGLVRSFTCAPHPPSLATLPAERAVRPDLRAQIRRYLASREQMRSRACRERAHTSKGTATVLPAWARTRRGSRGHTPSDSTRPPLNASRRQRRSPSGGTRSGSRCLGQKRCPLGGQELPAGKLACNRAGAGAAPWGPASRRGKLSLLGNHEQHDGSRGLRDAVDHVHVG
mmetsp:Transcript_16058/g.60739  ORF Transcript_16058/g.60739 Transcript_16058/m.60739 type:complete len:206 (-) Transcript_16058:940-1557(-)